MSLLNVSKSFVNTGCVLSNISIEIKKGDFVVLLGPSGSGKSTLLRLIAGLEADFDGHINFSDAKIFDKSFVFQEPHLMPWRTLLQNTELPLELMKVSKGERVNRATDVLTKVGLKNATHLYPSELSGGMKMRASLARALVAEPELLLMDEPFAALDEHTRFKLSEDLRNLWKQSGMTVVFVTHSVHEACFLANRVLVLSDKPAKIHSDIKINLPDVRTNSLRTESVFSEQLKRVYDSLENTEMNLK
ncbi:ABC transporter ATP-binding protein [bacterium]|nr:ABC transporter ATP-binding protein [bacterium]